MGPPPHRTGHPPLEPAVELLGIRSLDAFGDVVKREHTQEVDLNRDEPVVARVLQRSVDECRLAEPPGTDEPAVVRADHLVGDGVKLLAAADHVRPPQRLAVFERVLGHG
jgi:hypothetical protein